MSESTHADIQKPLKRRPQERAPAFDCRPLFASARADARRLGVISGQVAIDLGGHLIGAIIEEQTVKVKG